MFGDGFDTLPPMAEQPPKKPAGNTPSKPAAPAGSQPKAAPKAQPKVPAAEDNSFLLNIGGAPAASNPCPNCQQPMKPGSKLCVSCGFNLDAGTATKTHVMRAPRGSRSPSSGSTSSGSGGMSGDMIAFLVTAVVCALAVLIPLGMATSGSDDGSSFAIAFIAARLISFAVMIGAAYVTYEDSLLKAVAAFLFLPYAIYRCVIRQSNPILKGMAASLVVCWLFMVISIAERGGLNPQGTNGQTDAQFESEDADVPVDDTSGATPTPPG
jgi:hypothetical protein